MAFRFLFPPLYIQSETQTIKQIADELEPSQMLRNNSYTCNSAHKKQAGTSAKRLMKQLSPGSASAGDFFSLFSLLSFVRILVEMQGNKPIE